MTEQTQTTTEETTQTTATPDITQTQTEQTATTQTEANATTQTEGEQTPAETGVPESADAYAIGIDGFDMDGFKESNPEVFGKFHEAGISNDQATAVLKIWDEYNQIQVEALQEEWGGEFNQNLRFAQQAAKAAGLSDADLDSPTMGLKLAAFYGKQLQEDMPPAGNTQQSGAESIQQLMRSEAFLNPSHPEHAQVSQKVDAWYDKNYQ